MDDIKKQQDEERKRLYKELEDAKDECSQAYALVNSESVPTRQTLDAAKDAQTRLDEAYRRWCEFNGTPYQPPNF